MPPPPVVGKPLTDVLLEVDELALVVAAATALTLLELALALLDILDDVEVVVVGVTVVAIDVVSIVDEPVVVVPDVVVAKTDALLLVLLRLLEDSDSLVELPVLESDELLVEELDVVVAA